MHDQKFKVLVIADKKRFTHLEDFLQELNKKDIETKLIYDLDYVSKFFDINIIEKQQKKRKFKEILDIFNPDIVLLDRISKIAKIVISKNIPLWILLRGDYWEETRWAKGTIYKSKREIISVQKNEELVDYCFKNSKLILPISKYLEEQIRKRYPENNIIVFPADGRNPEDWKPTSNQKLKHPCVGLLQGLNVWGKTRELLTLNNVMKELPEVTFYLAGDGIYQERIIPELENNKNFIWLEHLKYPNEVKEFLSEIDLYMLLSGLEGLGQTIIESLLMKKPTIASNIGGIPEIIVDNKTGLLVETGDEQMIIKKIHKLIDDHEFGNQLAEQGYEFVKKEFAWKEIAKKFIDIIDTDWSKKNIE